MEIVRVLGVDPSLRNTGLAVVSYNTELDPNNPQAFSVSACQVLVNHPKYVKKDAIMNMIDMIDEESCKTCYGGTDDVIIEFPAVMFSKMPGSTLSALGHISGACVALFGVDRSHLFHPTEWNRGRKKPVTHNMTIGYLGHPDTWDYEKPVKSEKFMEHILDATSMAFWWIQENYLKH